jgi:endonuclease III
MSKRIKRGIFVVIDGLDGIGKGVCLDFLKEQVQDINLKVFDLNEYWKKFDSIPTLKEVGDVDVIFTSEPTYQGIGKYIRETLVSKNQARFSTSVIAQAYSLDREIMYQRLILPALKKGIHIFQSRSVSTSIAYQKLTGSQDGVDLKFILSLPGNRLALENAPSYLIIPTITDVAEVIKRLNGRVKDDNCLFENLEFQLKVKKEYDSKKFKEIFEKRGTKIVYIDVGKTLEYTKQEIRRLFKKEIISKLSDKTILSEKDIVKIKDRAQFVFNHVKKLYPEAKTELKNWETEFQFLICIILSAQTTDKQVNKITKALFKKYPDVKSLSNAKIEDVEKLVSSINHYKTKSRHIVAMSKMLVENFNSEVPMFVDDLLKLPGVGKKTANVFLNDLFKANQGIAVDTHVARVAQRLELTKEKNATKISLDLEKLYLRKDWYKINSTFVLFGRYNCKARKPLCKECPLREMCNSKIK